MLTEDTVPAAVMPEEGAGEGAADTAQPGEPDAPLAEGNAEIAALQERLAGVEAKLAETRHSLDEAVASYRSLAVRSEPEVVVEMVTGDSITAVDASLESARALVGRVRRDVEAEAARGRVPAGAPERRAPDVSGLTPREKIRHAIGGKR